MTGEAARPWRRGMLDPACAYVVALPHEILVGVGASAANSERQKAMLYAQSFLLGKQLPLWTPVARVVEGAEPAFFTAHFVGWPSARALECAAAGVGGISLLGAGADAHATALAAFDRQQTEESVALVAGAALKVWRVRPRGRVEVPPAEHGTFAANDSFVVECTLRTARRLLGMP